MFPTGNLVDEIDVPNIGRLKATLINAGIPTVFLNAADLGYTGKELQDDINNDAAALEKFETIRAYGALKMGLISDVSEAAARARTPKPAFVAPAADYTASSGKTVNAADIDLPVRWSTLPQAAERVKKCASGIRQVRCVSVLPPNVRTDNGRPPKRS